MARMAMGADDVVDSSKSFVMENFSSYHGTKPGYVDSIQKGIQKPKSGTQGNYDDDWKGFYSTDNKYDAAGYSVDNENPLSGKAGGVVKVTYPGLTKVLALKVDNAETIKKELGLSLTEPLMEQVGTEEFIKRFGDGASRVVLSLPFAEGSSSVEYINNWEQAKALSVELEINFETRGKRGQDAMYEYMAQACAGNRVRRIM
nr:modified diphteria toxin fragment [synthetic construct]